MSSDPSPAGTRNRKALVFLYNTPINNPRGPAICIRALSCSGGLDIATKVIQMEVTEPRKSHMLRMLISRIQYLYPSILSPSQAWYNCRI